MHYNREGTHAFLVSRIFVAAITFGASLVDMALQWVVPADVLTASKGSVGATAGLITLLSALVLDLLVLTAFRCSPRKSPEPVRSWQRGKGQRQGPPPLPS
jgi:hypothetical protein